MSDSGRKKPGLLGYNHACQTDSTSFSNQQQQQQVTSPTTMNTCNICHKQFSTPATLRRHSDALHAQQRTKFQCWSCNKIYARKENVLRHARKTHGDTDGKLIITTLTNTHYKPEIFKPKTWTPPMEARPRNIIRLNITTPKTSTATYTQIEDISTDTDHQLPQWTALTTTQLLKLYPASNNELLSELDISPSFSTSTICLDEETDTDREVAIHSIFNIFKKHN